MSDEEDRQGLMDSQAEDQYPDEQYHSNRGFIDGPGDEVRFASVPLHDFPSSLVPAGESGPELPTTSEQDVSGSLQECRPSSGSAAAAAATDEQGNAKGQPLAVFNSIQRHSITFMFGMISVLFALLIIGFVQFDGQPDKNEKHDENEKPDSNRNFYFFLILLIMHGVSFVACGLLMCYINFSSIRKISTKHLFDGLLLLIGMIAILVNSIYSSWKNISSIACNPYNTVTPCPNVSKSETGVELATNISGIVQSILQSCVLELILICELSRHNRLHRSLNCRFKRALKMAIVQFKNFICRNRRPGEDHPEITISQQRRNGIFYIAILNFLILVNGAEWLLSALCFYSFFSKEEDKSDWVSLLLMPLQVFFRFHSAVYIFELKNDLEKEGRTDENSPTHSRSNEEEAQPLLEECQE